MAGPHWKCSNAAARHAQLADLAIGSAERPQTVHPGLLGYVLGGQTMRWPLDLRRPDWPVPPSSARINGESAQTPLPAAPPAR